MSEEKFSWVATHKSIVNYLKEKQSDQVGLIELLLNSGIQHFDDQEPEGNVIPLTEIDPFTFFCYINKHFKQRLEIYQNVAKSINAPIPKDDLGIPTSNPQKVWMFPFKFSRNNNEIDRLWDLFNKELSGQITDQEFADALLIKGTGKTKLTEALFYVNPEKYLPINAPTKPYIKEILGINPDFNTYQEYLEVLTQIKEKSNLPFYEISYEAWKWNAERKQINYWIFQGNPKVFDFETALRDEILTDWTVSAHKDKIKVGDKVIIWITGNKSGCYALAEVTSEPLIKLISSDDHLWQEKKKNSLKAEIKIIQNLVDNPILKEKINGIKELKDLKVGNQGTNFSATQEEFQVLYDLSKNSTKNRYWVYAPGENARLWEEFYEEGIMALGWDEIGDLRKFQNRDEIKIAFSNEYGGESEKKKNDGLANDDFLNNINIGDVVFVKKGRGELLGYGIVESDYYFSENRKEFKHLRKVDWKLKGNWEVDFNFNPKTLTDITKYPSEHPDFDTFYERLFGIMGVKNLQSKKQVNLPLNTILYGPPGTGKTYNTVLRAAEIIENRIISSYDEALKIFKDKLHDQIEFITFHQNYSYEDFIQGLRPDTENDNQLSFERKDGVFKVIADKALQNLKDSEKSTVAKRPFEEVFNEFINPLVEGEVEEIEVKMKKVSYFITAITTKSIDFRKASGGSSHTLSIATLKKMYTAESVLDIQGLSSYYTPLLNSLLMIGKDSSGKKSETKRKNFVIIIDEINRANISRVFGELITLIEPDKRSHGAIPMEAKLPSGDPFVVPSNLYIIGTMNTADKSIALLDIALRRRFEFEAMYPKYEIDGQEIYDVDILKKINEQIIESKGHDFQIGHAYFMGENNDLVTRMNKKVIPLLLEYYMNDEKEVKAILQNTGLTVKEKTWPLSIDG